MTPITIISAYSPSVNLILNGARSADLAEDLSNYGLDYEVVAGCFQSFEEQSFAVTVPRGVADDGHDNVLALARAYNQEAVLHVDGDGLAYLIPTDENQPDVFLGTWTEVPESEARRNGNFTRFKTGHTYIAKKGVVSHA